MEGNRRIVLHEPQPGPTDAAGFPTAGVPIDRVVWATRTDRGASGGERLLDEAEVGEWQTRIRVRLPGLESLDTSWTLTDERGRRHDIERVAEPPGPRGRWWDIYAVARSG